ncbi:MAG: PorP/SprF family type IX secretion system membrane protein [Saprospiraceae bacterium]|nr:PorP/SprF family type IX secretion system membrane protein [Saprospiraceae bacterium]
MKDINTQNIEHKRTKRVASGSMGSAPSTIILIWLGLCFSSSLVRAQDPVFSQFFATPIQMNPAFTGLSEDAHISSVYRLQWPGISASYNTFALGYDQFFDASNLGLGFQINRDVAGNGALGTSRISSMLSYRLNINDETFIRGGIEASLIQKSLNWQKLLFYDAIESVGGSITPGGSYLPSAELEPANTRRAYLDIGSGLLLYNSAYYFGLAINHMNTPEDRFLRDNLENYQGLPLRWSVHGGYQFKLGRKAANGLYSFCAPNLLYTRQASFSQLNAGIYLAVNQLVGGIYFRQSGANGDAVIFHAGIRDRHYTLAYSFDYTVSGLTIDTGGGHEISVSYHFMSDKPRRSKLNDCLQLFR